MVRGCLEGGRSACVYLGLVWVPLSACFWEIVRGFVAYERSGNQIAPWGK